MGKGTRTLKGSTWTYFRTFLCLKFTTRSLDRMTTTNTSHLSCLCYQALNLVLPTVILTTAFTQPFY